MKLYGEVLGVVMVALIVWGVWGPIGRLFAKRWDVFVSYRSLDARVARQIASELSKCGIRVWIDSREIAPADRARGAFSAPVSQGLQRTTHAILCTSESYWKSDYCRKEASLILRRFRDVPQRIIIVKLDDSRDALAEFGAPVELTVVNASRASLPSVVDSLLSSLRQQV